MLALILGGNLFKVLSSRLSRIILLVLFFHLNQVLEAQDSIQIPLKMNYQFVQGINFTIDFKNDENERFPKIIANPGIARIGNAPGNVKVWAKRNSNKDNSYQIKIDTNGDDNITDEKEYKIYPDSAIKVKVKRLANNTEYFYPYLIKYNRYTKNNTIYEKLNWHPHYRAEGVLRIDSCNNMICLLDLNADGIFDFNDSKRGTNLCVDVNKDGKIWGSDEYIRGASVFEFCNKYFMVDSIEKDGSSLTLGLVNQTIPKIGEEIPQFILTLLNSEKIDTEELKGKIILLDFWASWCKPCIAGFPRFKHLMEKINNEINIISINVDEAKGYQNALKVVKDYNLKWPIVYLDKGSKYPLWKFLGNINNNKMSIPLYILINRGGIITYAGNGGTDLSDLEAHINMLH